MLSASMENGQLRYAPITEKQDGPFFCPSCSDGVILKKGNKKIHHFAHIPNVDCTLRGESYEHMTAKWNIYQALVEHENVSKAFVEFSLPKVRADVFFKLNNGQYVAVEIQKSKLSNESIIERTQEYSKNNIPVIWILTKLSHDKHKIRRVSVPKWQKFLHTMYYGKVYKWIDGLNVFSIHFAPYTETREGLYGSYEKFFKRYRNPSYGGIVNLVDDFYLYRRQAWSDVPSAILWKDNLKKWWG